MVHEVDAVFENGLLRPLEPLSLADKQFVHLTITGSAAPVKVLDRRQEQEWLRDHSREFPGQWVALQGDTLLGHGTNARAVRDEARPKGFDRPLLFHVPDEPDLPSAGWI
jgi:predicted DNA-binding antitoxin AbrB/MazE fold protein